MNEQRVELAEEFLREAVYRSRASQGAATLLAKQPSPDRGDRGACGLGEKAAVMLELTPRGRELFEQIFNGDGEETLAHAHECMRAWIEMQDALDRKRNHFLKAFRNEHGFDRTTYTAAETATFDAGLARINEEEARERRSAARVLSRG